MDGAPGERGAQDATGYIDSLNRDAFYLRESEQWDRMLAMSEEARSLAESIGYRGGIARALIARAFVRYIRSDFQAAINDCMSALELSTGHDAEGEGKALGTLAMVNWSVGNYEEALRQGDRSLELLHAAGDQVTEAFGFIAKAGILESLGQYTEALEWGRKGVEAFRKLEHTVGCARALAVVGSVHMALGDVQQAVAHHNESLFLARAINHRFAVSRALSDMGAVWEALEDIDKALQFHSDALAIRQEDGYRLAQTTSLLALGRVYRRKGDLDRAIDVLQNALEVAEGLGARPRASQIHEALAETYEEAGRLDLALKHLKAHGKLTTELATDRVSLRYRALTLEAQLSAVQNQAELEKMAHLGKLVAALAHEINSPLGAIRSSADVSARCARKLAEGADPRALEAMGANAQTIAEASARIGEVVDRLKSFAGIDQAPHTCLELVKALEDTVALLRPEFDGRVKVTVESEMKPRVYVYAAELQQAFMSLLRNAVESIEGPGTVRIRLSHDGQHFQIEFADSGRGIAADQIRHLFTPNFHSGSGRVKASLSLFTSMNIVKKHGGSIQVESVPGRGSKFVVWLPERLQDADGGLEAYAM